MFCTKCKKPTTTRKANFGIGGYEFWGSTESHDNIQIVSKCCDYDVVYELEEEEYESDQ
jgi:hypothetical protein